MRDTIVKVFNHKRLRVWVGGVRQLCLRNAVPAGSTPWEITGPFLWRMHPQDALQTHRVLRKCYDSAAGPPQPIAFADYYGWSARNSAPLSLIISLFLFFISFLFLKKSEQNIK